jgi:hypothetical protein
MSRRSTCAPFGSAGAARCAGDLGLCGGSLRPWHGRCRHGRWPDIASVQSDDAGSSVEREARCEPALCGAARRQLPWLPSPASLQPYTQALRRDYVPPGRRSCPGHDHRHPQMACSSRSGMEAAPSFSACAGLVCTSNLDGPAARAIALVRASSRLTRFQWRRGGTSIVGGRPPGGNTASVERLRAALSLPAESSRAPR